DLSVLAVSTTGPSGDGLSFDLRAGAYYLLLFDASGLPLGVGVSVVSCFALAALLAPSLTRGTAAAPSPATPPPHAAPESEPTEAVAEFLRQRQAMEQAKREKA